MAEAQDKARKEREKEELYALDISGVEWHSEPGTEEHEERVEIAYLPEGAVAMRSSLDPRRAAVHGKREWRAFVLGAGDGEFDLEPAPHGRKSPGNSAGPAGAPDAPAHESGVGTLRACPPRRFVHRAHPAGEADQPLK